MGSRRYLITTKPEEAPLPILPIPDLRGHLSPAPLRPRSRPSPRWVTYQTRLHLSRISPLHNGRTMVAQWPSFWRRDAGFSTPPSAQRGDANGPSVPRSGLAWHCAIGDACHWPGSRLAIVSFRAFLSQAGHLVGVCLERYSSRRTSHPGDGVVGCSLMSLVRARRWARWISGSGRSGCQLAAMSQREP